MIKFLLFDNYWRLVVDSLSEQSSSSSSDPLSGNQGLWGEIAVLLNILIDGGFFEGDDDHLNIRQPHVFHKVCSLRRNESKNKRVIYQRLNESIDTIVNNWYKDNTTISILVDGRDILKNNIKKGSGYCKRIPDLDNLLARIHVASLRITTDGKVDIIVQVLDKNNKPGRIIRFSIKTLLFSPATLLSNSSATIEPFSVQGLTRDQINELTNKYQGDNFKIKEFIKEIYQLGGILVPVINDDKDMNSSLINVDSDIRLIQSYCMIYYYRDSIILITDLIDRLIYDNPLNYEMKDRYTKLLQNLLESVVLGHNPKDEWEHLDNMTGGYLIYTRLHQVLSYPIDDRQRFRNTLLINTKFDSPSYKKGTLGRFYFVDDDVRINLGYMIKFTLPPLSKRNVRKCHKKDCKIIRHNHHMTNGKIWVN